MSAGCDDHPVKSSWSRRVVVLAVLACWHASTIALVGLGLHLLLDHHHGVGETHRSLPVAATHGHHHDLDVAEHDHAAVAQRDLETAEMPLSPARNPAATGPLVVTPDRLDIVDGRPPDTTRCRFYDHCALLL